MASAVAGSIAGSIGSSLLGFGANLLTSKGIAVKIVLSEQFDGGLKKFIINVYLNANS